MWNSFSNYSKESTIHSMNYIGKKNLHWIERIFWMSAFLFSLTTCSYLIFLTYKKWDNDPVLVTFNERSTPTWKIPFPAISICPESKTNIEKFNLSRVIELFTNNKTLSKEEEIGLEVFAQICGLSVYSPKNSSKPKGNYIRKIREIQNDFVNMSLIRIANIDRHFREMFKEVITDEGVCYSFNMLHEKDLFKPTMNYHLKNPIAKYRSDWNVFGYNETASADTYPYRILGSGVKTGLTIWLVMRKKDVNYACQETNGFRLTFHTPDEMPQPQSHFYRLAFDVETLINVLPRKMSTSSNLKNYKPRQRQCYFRGEKRLKFFKHYNQANCKLECFTNLTLKMCGCVKFSMPNTHGTAICNSDHCISRLETLWTFLELQKGVVSETNNDVKKKDLSDTINDIYEAEFENGNLTQRFLSLESDVPTVDQYDHEEYLDYAELVESGLSSCKCLPSCTSIHYDAEISQTKLNVIKHYKATSMFEAEDEELLYSGITIYFKEDNFLESKRAELYGWINFLSSCGGFLGLLMGGSLLSLVEIIYHLTMRKIFRPNNRTYDEENLN